MKVLIAVATLLLFVTGKGNAAEISIAPSNWWVTGPTYHLHIDGEIEIGDFADLKELLGSTAGSRPHWIALSLNSPGGNLLEALKIADYLQRSPYRVVTDVMQRNGEPGVCASACTMVFLAGRYRFFQEGSKFGVHQFSTPIDTIERSSVSIAQAQNMSALISNLISKAGVDPNFHFLAASTEPETTRWLELSELERLHVVNNGRSLSQSDYTLTDGEVALVITNLDMYGVNRLTVACGDSAPVFVFEVGVNEAGVLGDSGRLADEDYINSEFSLNIFADSIPIQPSRQTPIEMEGARILRLEFQFDGPTSLTVQNADRIDVRLNHLDGGFLGSTFPTSDGKLSSLAENCGSSERTGAPKRVAAVELEEVESPVLAAALLTRDYSTVRTSKSSELEPNKERFIRAFNKYLRDWSLANDISLAAMSLAYGDRIEFYGATLTKAELLEEKRAFAVRWPQRQYSTRDGLVEVSCSAELCKVTAIIDWLAESPARDAIARGVALYTLGFDRTTSRIIFEDGESRSF